MNNLNLIKNNNPCFYTTLQWCETDNLKKKPNFERSFYKRLLNYMCNRGRIYVQLIKTLFMILLGGLKLQAFIKTGKLLIIFFELLINNFFFYYCK
jgi:hypothetical protein